MGSRVHTYIHCICFVIVHSTYIYVRPAVILPTHARTQHTLKQYGRRRRRQFRTVRACMSRTSRALMCVPCAAARVRLASMCVCVLYLRVKREQQQRKTQVFWTARLSAADRQRQRPFACTRSFRIPFMSSPVYVFLCSRVPRAQRRRRRT